LAEAAAAQAAAAAAAAGGGPDAAAAAAAAAPAAAGGGPDPAAAAAAAAPAGIDADETDDDLDAAAKAAREMLALAADGRGDERRRKRRYGAEVPRAELEVASVREEGECSGSDE